MRKKRYDNSITTTIIGKLLLQSDSHKRDINSLMSRFQSAKRMAFNLIVKDGIIERGEIESYIKARIPSLNTRYMRDAIIEAEGIIASQKELLPVYLKATEQRLKRSQEKLSLYERGDRQPKKPIELVVKGISKRIEKLKQRQEELKTHISNNTIPNIVFGGRKNLIRLQRGMLSKEEWRALRSNSFYSRGDASKGGNLHTRIYPVRSKSPKATATPSVWTSNGVYYNDQTEELRIRLSIPQENGRCGYIFCGLILPEEKRHISKREILMAALENKLPYSVRVKRRGNNYEAHITLDEAVYGGYVKKIPDSVAKVAGIDINVDRIAVVVCNRDGNFLKRKTFYSDELEYTKRGKRDFVIHGVVRKVFDWLLAEQVEAIVAERLDFGPTVDTSRVLNRIKGNFTYRKLHNAINRKALRCGMYVRFVNSAYTTRIGLIKYARGYGISRHEAGAYVIARRGLGYDERIPKAIVGQIPVLIARLNQEVKGAKEAAKERLLKDLQLFKNWKMYSPVETEHKWKLWSLIGKFQSLLCPEFPVEGISGESRVAASLTGDYP